jgi:hypothetical protein
MRLLDRWFRIFPPFPKSPLTSLGRWVAPLSGATLTRITEWGATFVPFNSPLVKGSSFQNGLSFLSKEFLSFQFSSLIVVSLLFLAKYFFGIFLYLRIIDYFRLKIDDLRNAFNCKIISSERRSEATATNRQLSIVNLQFFFFGSGLSGLGLYKNVLLPNFGTVCGCTSI